MKYIITESQKDRVQVLRRTEEDWGWIRDIVNEGLDMYYPCDFKNEKQYLERVSVDSANTYLYNYLDDWRSETFSQLSEYITSLIKERMSNEIVEFYQYRREDECD